MTLGGLPKLGGIGYFYEGESGLAGVRIASAPFPPIPSSRRKEKWPPTQRRTARASNLAGGEAVKIGGNHADDTVA